MQAGRERLVETLSELNEADWMTRDQSVWLIGSFPELDVEDLLKDHPNLTSLLPVDPCSTRTEALLQCSQHRNQEDLVGRVAELLIKWLTH